MRASRCSAAICASSWCSARRVTAEKAFFASLGAVAETASMRSMARLPDGSDQALVELKAVDAAYPLYGALATTPALPIAELFAERGGVFGAAAPDMLFERLGLQTGDQIKVGGATFQLRALLDKEPDAASDGFGFAPRLMVSLDALAGDRADPARQPVQRRLQGAARRQRRRGRIDRHPRPRRRRIPGSRLEHQDPNQCRAGAVRQHRALFAVPDAGRADGAGGRRRRRRQCGARLSRRQARRHRHLQEPRRLGRPRVPDLSRADHADRCTWHRHRAGGRRGHAVRGRRAAVVRHPGAGARAALYPAALAMAALFGIPGDARLRADSARPGARRAGDGAVSRDGLREPRPAPPRLHRGSGR